MLPSTIKNLILAVLCSSAFAAEPVKTDALKWFTPDRDFKAVEPAAWVYEGVQKAFVGTLRIRRRCLMWMISRQSG